MGFIKRALCYITRKRGKTFLLFMMLLVMSTLVLTGLSVRKASEQAQRRLRERLGGKFLIGVDYSDSNPYLYKETILETEDRMNFIIYSTVQLLSEQIAAVKQLPGVKYCDAKTESLAVFENLSLFPGNIPIDQKYSKSTKTTGVWRTEDSAAFTSGAFSLAEGRHITEHDTYAALISRDLAERNGLRPGDRIQTKSTAERNAIEIEIVGLFDSGEPEAINDQVTSYDKRQNQIFLSLQTAIAIEASPAVQGFNQLEVTVEDPERMDAVIAAVEELDIIDWAGFTVIVDNAAYQNAAQPLASLNDLTASLLAAIIAVSVIVLSLLLTLWSRTRIHETGVLLAVGIGKCSIVGQYLTEALIIAILAFSLSFFTGSAVAGQIGNRLLTAGTAREQTNAENEKTAAENREAASSAAGVSVSLDGSAGMTAPDPENREPDIQVSIGPESFIQLYFIGIAVIFFSVIVSSVTVMRLKPREILSIMS